MWTRLQRRSSARVWCLVGVAATLAACGATSTSAPPAPYVSVPASAPDVVTFYLGLTVNDAALRTAATAAANPATPGYRHFSTVAQAGARFGPDDDTLRAMGASVTGLGLRFAVDPTRVFARVSGTPAQWAKALGAPLGVTKGTPKNPFTTYILPARVPDALVPKGTAILLGAAQTYDPTIESGQRDSGAQPAATAAAAGPAPTAAWPTVTGTPYQANCQSVLLQGRHVYTPSQVKTAYGVDSLPATSTPPVITILDLGGGWSQNDLKQAAACFGYPAPSVAQTQGDGVPTRIAAADDETTLDLQTVSSVAPNAQVRIVQTTSGGGAFLDAFSRALATSPLPDVVSVSYGACAVVERQDADSYVTAMDQVLATAALAGVGVYIAAGDSGSTTCRQVPGPTLSFPAVSQFVTAVGGTRIVLGPQNSLVNEVVWNDARYGQAAAGGGGVSVSVAQPWYQQGFTVSPMRTVPDVSALAAIVPGWPIVINDRLQTVGGTSGATPFTAAAAARVGAAERSAGRPAVGLANGWFYRAAQTNPGAFVDVMQGSNDLHGVGCCTATSGYDLASGLGSPVWSVLPGLLPRPALG